MLGQGTMLAGEGMGTRALLTQDQGRLSSALGNGWMKLAEEWQLPRAGTEGSHNPGLELPPCQGQTLFSRSAPRGCSPPQPHFPHPSTEWADVSSAIGLCGGLS